MCTEKQQTQFFDFSLDALAFKKKLAEHLKNAASAFQLEDDELEYVNAAGVPQKAPADDDLL